MQQHRVVVVEEALADCSWCTDFTVAPVYITLIDRHNHHLFQLLLYQVATTIRRRLLLAFKRAEFAENEAERWAQLTFVVGAA